MGATSLILSFASFVLAIVALYKAKSAYDLAKTVVGRKNEHEDAQRLRDLLTTLNAAKEAAMRGESASAGNRSPGHANRQAMQRLQTAEDALRTKLPISWNDRQRSEAGGVANEIEQALDVINNTQATRDGWKNARGALQKIIPNIEKEGRQFADSALLPIKI